MKKNGRRNPQSEIIVDDHVIKTLHVMLANLMGTKGRLHEMQDRITVDDIPANLPVERGILDTLNALNIRNMPPTVDNVADALAGHGWSDAVRRIAAQATEDRDIASLSFILKRIHFRKAKNLSLAQRLQEVFNSPEGMPEEHLREVMRLVARELPKAYAGSRMTDLEAFEFIQEILHNRFMRRLEGLPMGPTFPWHSLRSLIPVLLRGNMTSLMAKSKFGKTTIAIILAEWWAWTQGYDVLYIHLENNHEQLWYRIMARHCLVPSEKLKTGFVDPAANDNDPFVIKLRNFYRYKLSGEDRGRIMFDHAPGATPEDLEAKIITAKEEATARGRDLMVIVDYYQQIDTTRWANTPVPLDACADWLKIVAETQDVYMFAFVQEDEFKDQPFGGRNIIKRSQIFMRFVREWVESNAGVDMWGTLDTLGNPRIKQAPGMLKAAAAIHVTHANDDTPGIVNLMTEMAFYKIWDPAPPPAEEMPHMDIESFA